MRPRRPAGIAGSARRSGCRLSCTHRGLPAQRLKVAKLVGPQPVDMFDVGDPAQFYVYRPALQRSGQAADQRDALGAQVANCRAS